MNINEINYCSLIESLLWVAGAPIQPSQVVEIILTALESQDDPTLFFSQSTLFKEIEQEHAVLEELVAKARPVVTEAVKNAFLVLMERYQNLDREIANGFELVQVAGGYQLQTHQDNSIFVQQFLQVKPSKLSRAQIETLSIVAYKQPVTRAEIEQVRGVDCGGSLKTLLERKLLRILGKKDEVGRPLIYGTSQEFLEYFRLNSLSELPTLRDLRSLPEEEIEEPLMAQTLLSLAQGSELRGFDEADQGLLDQIDHTIKTSQDLSKKVIQAFDADTATPAVPDTLKVP